MRGWCWFRRCYALWTIATTSFSTWSVSRLVEFIADASVDETLPEYVQRVANIANTHKGAAHARVSVPPLQALAVCLDGNRYGWWVYGTAGGILINLLLQWPTSVSATGWWGSTWTTKSCYHWESAPGAARPPLRQEYRGLYWGICARSISVV